MSFLKIVSFRLSDNPKFKKDISVMAFKRSEGQETRYIDLRLKFINNLNEECFTKRGVTLIASDLVNLLPIWLAGNDHEYCWVSPIEPNNNRKVSFTKRGGLFELRVKKRSDYGSKEQYILLTKKELIEMDKIKQHILNNLQ